MWTKWVEAGLCCVRLGWDCGSRPGSSTQYLSEWMTAPEPGSMTCTMTPRWPQLR